MRFSFFQISKKEKGPAPPPPTPNPPPTISPAENPLDKAIAVETEKLPTSTPASASPSIPTDDDQSDRRSLESTDREFESQSTHSGDTVNIVSVSTKPVSRTSSIDDSRPPAATISITSTPAGKLSSSTITINSNEKATTPVILSDHSNSLASNVSQVTVVTSHPPVLVDNTAAAVTIVGNQSQLESPGKMDVVIVSNELNKSRHLPLQEHHSLNSTEEEYPSLDSLEFSPLRQHGQILIGGHQARARKLDESEVFIVSVEDDSMAFEDSLVDVPDQSHLDMSHVSVVTVGEQIHVKDSSDSVASTVGNAVEYESDEPHLAKKNKLNGQPRGSAEDLSIIVNKQRSTNKNQQRISPDSSVGSLESRSQSENGSLRSASGMPAAVVSGQANNSTKNTNKIDRSDAESIATTASHDSRDPADGDEVVIRPKPAPAPVPNHARSKEEIELRNLRKKTRKRTRKFEIDGVQVTTTTSRVIYGDDENGKQYDDHIIRKQELRELKMLQKQEKKQFLELQTKEGGAREQQERRFEQERITLERTYEADMDTLARQHKQLVDRTEQQQETDLRATSKRIRAEQERELKLVSSLTNSILNFV